MFFDLHLARIIFTFAHTTRRDARTRRQYKKFFVRTAISPPFSRKTTPHCELSSAARNARVTPSKTIYIISATLCPKPLSASRKRRGNTRFVTLPPLHSAALRLCRPRPCTVLPTALPRGGKSVRRGAENGTRRQRAQPSSCPLPLQDAQIPRGGGQPCLPLHSSLKPHKIKARRSGLFVFCVSCKNYLRGFLMLAPPPRRREAAGNPASRFTPRSNLTKPKPAEAGFLSFVCPARITCGGS